MAAATTTSTSTTTIPAFNRDRYHYGLFACCQGMYQLGSPYWDQFFPRTVRTVLANQQPTARGTPKASNRPKVRQFLLDRPGDSRRSAPPNQLLPVFQR